MRREIISLLRSNATDADPNNPGFTELFSTGAEIPETVQEEDELSGSEVGRGDIQARIGYTPGVAEVEEQIDAAMFRGKRWNVVSKNRDYFRMTLGLERGGQ